MKTRYEEMWRRASGDGAACLRGVLVEPERCEEADGMLEAWYHERSGRLEAELLLGQARRLLARVLADGAVSPRARAKARRLVREIRRFEADS